MPKAAGPQILRLEYGCTAAEKREAESLSLRKQLGGGSKWQMWVVLGVMLVVVLGLFYAMLRTQVPAPYRPYVLLGTFAVFVFIFLRNRRATRGSKATNTVEISEAGITLLMGLTKISSPWSFFSDCLESPNLFVLMDRTKSTLLIFPKRVFPDEASQGWFRSLAGPRLKPAEPLLAPGVVPADSTDRIVLRFRLGFRDYVHRTLFSARTWGAVLFLAAATLGLTLYAGAHPPPRPVYTIGQVYFMFVLPITVFVGMLMVLFLAVNTWFSHKPHLIPQETILSQESITFISSDGTGVFPWTIYTSYKETSRCFIVWNPKGGAWMLLPKRAFASPEEWSRCRELLAAHLRRSNWFFG